MKSNLVAVLKVYCVPYAVEDGGYTHGDDGLIVTVETSKQAGRVVEAYAAKLWPGYKVIVKKPIVLHKALVTVRMR